MWHRYKNGNYVVAINDTDGTKIRRTEDDEFCAEFPESMDINITQKCNGCCPFCYAECTPDGRHGDIMGAKFIDTLKPYTETALQVNDLSHPDLLPFLKKLKTLKVFPSITVNQKHFEQKEDFIAQLINDKLIYGLGISLVNPTGEFIRKAQQYPNAVIHTINGITTPHDYIKLVDKNLKVLILGYKDKGRGHDYLVTNEEKVRYNQKWLYENVSLMMKHNWYNVLSFDNLALEQLKIKEQISPEDFDKFYQGEEGTCSMYVDLVDKTFGVSSLVPKKEMLPLKDDVVEMFKVVKSL